MSLIKKADVKSHLSKVTTSVFPFGLKRSEERASDARNPGANAEAGDISISPSHPISPEAVPNAQVGGSVGVRVNEAKSGQGSW